MGSEMCIRDSLHGKQSFWDRPGLLTDSALIESPLFEQSQRARFLAAQAPHSGDWLLALPIANYDTIRDEMLF